MDVKQHLAKNACFSFSFKDKKFRKKALTSLFLFNSVFLALRTGLMNQWQKA